MLKHLSRLRERLDWLDIRYGLATFGPISSWVEHRELQWVILLGNVGCGLIRDTLFPSMPQNRGNLLKEAPWTKRFIPATCGLLPTPKTNWLLRLALLVSPPPSLLVPAITEWNPHTPNGPLRSLTWAREKNIGLLLLSPTVTVMLRRTGEETTSVYSELTTLSKCPTMPVVFAHRGREVNRIGRLAAPCRHKWRLSILVREIVKVSLTFSDLIVRERLRSTLELCESMLVIQILRILRSL